MSTVDSESLIPLSETIENQGSFRPHAASSHHVADKSPMRRSFDRSAIPTTICAKEANGVGPSGDHLRSLRGTTDPPRRMDHVYEGRPYLFPLTGLEAAVRIDPYLIGRKTLLRLVEKRHHLVDRWTTRRMNVVNARANFVRIAIGGEGIEQLYLGAGGLNRDYVGVERTDGVDDVVELRVAHVSVNLRLIGNPRRGKTETLHGPVEIGFPLGLP